MAIFCVFYDLDKFVKGLVNILEMKMVYPTQLDPEMQHCFICHLVYLSEGDTKLHKQTWPLSANSLATSATRLMFSSRSCLLKPRFLFKPVRMLSPSKRTSGCLLDTTKRYIGILWNLQERGDPTLCGNGSCSIRFGIKNRVARVGTKNVAFYFCRRYSDS